MKNDSNAEIVFSVVLVLKTFLPNWILIVFVNIIFILSQFMNIIVASVIGCIFVIVVLLIRNQKAKESIKELGLTTEEEALFQEHQLDNDINKSVQLIATAQERNRNIFKDISRAAWLDIH